MEFDLPDLLIIIAAFCGICYLIYDILTSKGSK